MESVCLDGMGREFSLVVIAGRVMLGAVLMLSGHDTRFLAPFLYMRGSNTSFRPLFHSIVIVLLNLCS